MVLVLPNPVTEFVSQADLIAPKQKHQGKKKHLGIEAAMGRNALFAP
jgi:hypothetical protein